MFYAVVLFCSFCRVPAAKVACKVTCDAAHTQNVLAVADRTLVVYHSLVAAVVAGIYRVVDRAVSYAGIVHYFYNLGYGLYVLLSFAIQLYVSDVSA